jgi:hypothetical protein
MLMTTISMMRLYSFYISFSHFEDQLQGKNLKVKLLDQEARVGRNNAKKGLMKKIRRLQCADHNWSYEYQNEARNHALES